MRGDGTCATRDADDDARARDDDARRAWDRPRSHRVAIDVEQSRALAHRRHSRVRRALPIGATTTTTMFFCV
jgi:hypothetical protein